MEDRNVSKATEEGLEYNTLRGKIKLPQYGRNIQKLVEYALKIKDREERNKAAELIIEAMVILNFKIRTIDNYKKILWNHLAMIADYKLDVDYPYEIDIEKEYNSKPEIIPLSKKKPKKRQYGIVIENMIKHAYEIEDKELQALYIEMILVQMKRIYMEWNRDIVSDVVIFDDFKKLGGDKLNIPKDFKLPSPHEIRSKFYRNYQQRKYKKNTNKR